MRGSVKVETKYHRVRVYVMKELFHFDPVNLVAILVIAIAAWVTMRNTLTWHTAWIRKHDEECDELRQKNGQILTQLLVTNEHLKVLVEANAQRLDRSNEEIIRIRDRTHELGNALMNKKP